ncbi:MAG: hypothetical protein HC883_02985 [Bdellovibrionaceae bacterium]|nr:hypothetical protein [Pseudobdellovibrionaceae bacterium]
MAKRKPRAQYRWRLFKGKKRLALKRLRYADSYELWYGSRRVLKRSPFPFKRVGERRDFMSDVVSSVELMRMKRLKKRREKYARKRMVEYEKKARKQLKREVPEGDWIGEELAKSFRESQKQRPNV